MGSGDYGNACITFTLMERNETQAKNPGGGGGAQSVPGGAASGSLLGGFEDALAGILNPITSFIKENPFERYMGTKKGTFTKPYTKIVEDIIMYVPGDASTSYKSKWEEQNAPIAGAAKSAWDAGSGVLSSAWEGFKNGAGAAFTQAAGGGSGGLTDYFMSQYGTAPNPNKQLYFKDMEFRTHTFTFNMYSKSPEESHNIRRIINLFKFNMHPGSGKSEGNTFIYDYPGWFDIKYYVNGVKNQYMHNFKKTILESMDVKYAPEQIYVTHEDGSPTHVILQLNFRELEILVKRDFQNEKDSC